MMIRSNNFVSQESGKKKKKKFREFKNTHLCLFTLENP